MNFFFFRSNARFGTTTMSASNETNYVSSKLNQSVEQSSVDVQRNLAQSMKLKAAMTNQSAAGNAYLESVSMKGAADVSNYENYSQQRMAAQSINVSQPIENATNIAKVEKVAQPVMASSAEEVSFKVEKMEDKPAVIVNHFEGDVTASTQQSQLAKANEGMFGQLLSNFYHAFSGLDTKTMKGPGFAMVFAALCFVIPTPAFAATAVKMTAAGATVAAQSNMTKLLKSVMCAGMAAVITVTFIHPIDVVKTRMQVA